MKCFRHNIFNRNILQPLAYRQDEGSYTSIGHSQC